MKIKHDKILLHYLDKYWDKLFGHVIKISKDDHEIIIIISRTNNISEHKMHSLKKGWRRKLGVKKLARILQAARHEEFLVTNLNKQDYIDAVYGGSLDNIPFCFAKYCTEAFEIRKLRKNPDQKEVLSIGKKSLRQPDTVLNISKAIEKLMCR